MTKVAILDDWSGTALSFGDWSVAQKHAELTVFAESIAPQDIPAKLGGFDVICAFRERTPFTREIFAALPNLKLFIASDGHCRNIDYAAAENLGIEVVRGEARSDMPMALNGTNEFGWGLLLAMVRQIPAAAERLRKGEWWHPVGMSLEGATLGIVGLGRSGAKMAEYGRVFGMNVIAWSHNLSDERAAELGATRVEKDELFRRSDIVTVHYVLSDRSRRLISGHELNLMKPSAYFMNISRGPIIDEDALIRVLEERRIAGAALDVFDREPLPRDHPFLKLDNVIATPHLAFTTEPTLRMLTVALADALNGYFLRR